MTEPDTNGQPAGDPKTASGETAADGDRTMDALIAGSRLLGGGVVGDQYEPVGSLEAARIRAAVNAFLARQDELPKARRVTRGKLADAIGESKSTVSQVLSDKYPKSKTDGCGKIDEVLRKLDKHLAVLEARQESPQRSDFAWTKIAEEIRGVANTAVILETIGAVYGPAGIGKTLTLEALLDVYPGSVLVTIDDEAHSPTTFLRTLADKLKLPSARHRQALKKSICTCLRASRRLVIVDEAHLAGIDVLTCVRQIHDSTSCPVIFAGLPALAKTLLQGRGDDSKGATLYSRVGIARDLTERCKGGDHGEPLFSIADVKRIFARSALRIARDAVDWLQALACMPEIGGLRTANNALRLATHVGRQRGETEVTLAMLQSACRLLHGTEGARAIANRIRQAQKVA
ncbi:MAG TPA: AAA family ATPase [Phycisphaerae bacterium]|nr:AAA family ATPase [Phycisphaerae bacterium]